MKTIPLTNSDKVALVDDEDYLLLLKHNSTPSFRLNNTGSIVVWSKPFNSWIPIARIILNLNLKYQYPEADHRDRDRLNNLRNNLRRATHSQNNANKTKRKGCSSKYKGVYFFKRVEKWVAQICVNNKMKNLGYFTDEVEAAIAYDDAAIVAFGEFALLNFQLYGA